MAEGYRQQLSAARSLSPGLGRALARRFGVTFAARNRVGPLTPEFRRSGLLNVRRQLVGGIARVGWQPITKTRPGKDVGYRTLSPAYCESGQQNLGLAGGARDCQWYQACTYRKL